MCALSLSLYCFFFVSVLLDCIFSLLLTVLQAEANRLEVKKEVEKQRADTLQILSQVRGGACNKLLLFTHSLHAPL